MRVLPCADSGVLVELGSLDEVHALRAALVQQPPAGMLGLVPAARTLLVQLDPRRADVAEVEREVRNARLMWRRQSESEVLRIPVVYDGEDLVEVARLVELSEREVVAEHTAAEWTVAFGGFAPGFGYLTGGSDRLRVPRKRESRTRVPAGSVGLAAEFSGIYPSASPGGWQLIGRTDVPVWQVDRDPPALLRPGVRVRFVETV